MKRQRKCKDCGKSIMHRLKTAQRCKPCARKRKLKQISETRRKDRKLHPEKYREYNNKSAKKCGPLRTKVLQYFKEKYNCRTVEELWNKIEERNKDG